MKEITFSLDSRGKQPLYMQIYRHFAGQISAGQLRAQEKLPSKRALAQHLNISLSTVENAYAMLIAEGYVAAKSKRGYFVEAVAPLVTAAPKPRAGKTADGTPQPGYDFSTGAVDMALFPYKIWIKLFKETLYSSPGLLGRGDAQGEIDLREALADFLYEYRGVRCQAAQIVIGPGSNTLLGEALALFAPGTVLGYEDPGYAAIWQRFEAAGLRAVPCPVDEKGLSAGALRQSRAQLAYVTPSHQFPLGITMPIGRRSQLLGWSKEEKNRYIIEDDYDSEFRHQMRPIPAMQGLEPQQVIYLGTFSRSLAPSMRLAYMVLPQPLVGEYQKKVLPGRDTVSRFEQRTLSRFIGEGHYARHLRRAGRVYAARCAALVRLLSDIPQAQINGEKAGLHFLLTIPQHTEKQLLAMAAKGGIRLAGVSQYYREQTPLPSTVVIGYAGLADAQLAGAVQTLRHAWKV